MGRVPPTLKDTRKLGNGTELQFRQGFEMGRIGGKNKRQGRKRNKETRRFNGRKKKMTKK
jgi:hypothetical protein